MPTKECTLRSGHSLKDPQPAQSTHQLKRVEYTEHPTCPIWCPLASLTARFLLSVGARDLALYRGKSSTKRICKGGRRQSTLKGNPEVTLTPEQHPNNPSRLGMNPSNYPKSKFVYLSGLSTLVRLHRLASNYTRRDVEMKPQLAGGIRRMWPQSQIQKDRKKA